VNLLFVAIAQDQIPWFVLFEVVSNYRFENEYPFAVVRQCNVRGITESGAIITTIVLS
jgi:hypothetical protein